MKQLPLLIASCAAVALSAASGPFAADAFAQARNQQAQAAAQPRGGASRSDPFGGFGGNSKEPIRIDANKLEVFDKEQKAIYSGDVVAVRGAAVTRSTTMTIFYESKRGQNAEGGQRQQPQPAAAAGGATQDGALKRIEFGGPVTVVNGTQTLKADNMIYDAVAKVVTLKGNATVADGPNIQRGELMTYNTESGIANIVTPGGRVQGVFTPGSEPEGQTQPKRR
jgi:lipopolysaccharide export system protein LptA